MKNHIETEVIHNEYLQLLQVIMNKKKRIGRPLTIQEENDILIPIIEKHHMELFNMALEHLMQIDLG